MAFLSLSRQIAYMGITFPQYFEDTESSSLSPNSGSSSSTHSESTDSTASSLPDSARGSAASSNITFFGDYPEWDSPSAESGPTHNRSHDQSHDQVEAQRAHLDCNICFNAPPTHPVATHCGHLFCSPCLNQWLQDRAKPCPVCRTMIKAGVNIVKIYCSTSDPSDGK